MESREELLAMGFQDRQSIESIEIKKISREELLAMEPQPEGTEVIAVNYGTMERTNDIRILEFDTGKVGRHHLYEIANDGKGRATILQQRWVDPKTKEYVWVAISKIVK